LTDLSISLLPWQQQVWENPTRFEVIAAGRRVGKSRFAAYKMFVKALDGKNGSVFYVAPTQGQARDIMWKLLLEIGGSIIAKAHINNLEITLINGTSIYLKGGDRPETMRGISLKYLVLDEYADIRQDVWEQILRPALADQKGDALFIGTPMGRNHFYDLYKYAELGDDDQYRAWHFTSYDNPMLDEAEINSAKKSMSSFAFRQEFMASFEAMGSEMFKEDWVKFGEKPKGAGDYYIAIDLAGFEDVSKKRKKKSTLDNSAIAVVYVNENGWFVENMIYGRWTLDETATKIFQAVRDYKPMSVGIERGISKQAVMSPLMDLMRRQSFFFNVVELTHGNQKKTDRVMWALQGRFENGLVTLAEADWNVRFLDELFQFPDPLTHDDLIDSLAYVDQMAKVAYEGNWEEYDTYEPLDAISGF